jgi:ABC-type sulfate transport system permease component
MASLLSITNIILLLIVLITLSVTGWVWSQNKEKSIVTGESTSALAIASWVFAVLAFVAGIIITYHLVRRGEIDYSELG